MRRFTRLAAAGLLAVSVAATAQGPRLAALGAILPGSWQLREAGTDGASRTICVRDADALLQVRHGGSACARFTLDDGPRQATIRYTCPGQGNGRTTITVDNGSQLRIQTQGIAGGAPFDLDYEARRVGACGDLR